MRSIGNTHPPAAVSLIMGGYGGRRQFIRLFRVRRNGGEYNASENRALRGGIGLPLIGAMTIGYLEKILSINAAGKATRLMLTGLIIVEPCCSRDIK